MSVRRRTICLICGAAERIERHHVGRAENLDVTVPLCHPCHRRVWTLELAGGSHRRDASEPQRAWTILHGFLALIAVFDDEWDSELADARGGMLALLCSLTDEPVGPNPTSGAVGAGRRQRVTAARRDAVDRERFARGLLNALAGALEEWLPDSGLSQLVVGLADGRRLESPSDVRTMRELTARSGDLTRSLARMTDRSPSSACIADEARDVYEQANRVLRGLSA